MSALGNSRPNIAGQNPLLFTVPQKRTSVGPIEMSAKFHKQPVYRSKRHFYSITAVWRTDATCRRAASHRSQLR